MQVRGQNILVDCGITQGHEAAVPIEKWPVKPAEVDFIFLTHAHIDYVFSPKKDIKNIGEITKEDSEFLVDLFLAARHLIEVNKYQKHKFYANGPGHQKITYLHFHLLVD